MRLTDALYGEFDIPEPVVGELIALPEFQRLRGVSNGGWHPGDPFFAGTVTRYEHSIGVFLLLRKFGAGLAEQLAGLLHDVSHGAFSHCLDYLSADADQQKTQTSQDSRHAAFLAGSEFAAVLARHGIAVEEVADESRYGLLESALPDICADRIDYALRQWADFPRAELPADASPARLAEALRVADGRFVFRAAESAGEFASAFNRMSQVLWASFGATAALLTTARCLRRALALGLMTRGDLYRMGDMEASALMEASPDPELRRLLADKRRPTADLAPKPGEPFETAYNKNRRVNPLYLDAAGRPTRAAAEASAPFFEHRVRL
ncbi:hypothetical protein FACS1894186_2850 [Alphaproteobacteria bacterium]|nr:hypothetical protein FACS1894186_2850 [Alphaproteobacteria bacterium]